MAVASASKFKDKARTTDKCMLKTVYTTLEMTVRNDDQATSIRWIRIIIYSRIVRFDFRKCICNFSSETFGTCVRSAGKFAGCNKLIHIRAG